MFYVDASSKETMETDLAGIAVDKKIGKSAADATQWMEGQRDWLLVLDSADDPRLDLSKFVPQTRHGNTVITSRNAQTRTYGLQSGSYREIVDMDPDEAKELFIRRAGLVNTEDQRHMSDAREDEAIQTIVKVRIGIAASMF